MDNNERNLEHFEGRLDKETYSKADVARLLHSEAQFTAQKTRGEFSEHVSRAEFENLNSQLESAKGELAPFKEAEFKQTVGNSFAELNGNQERLDDVIKLAGIKQGTKPEEIKAAVVSIKESGKYDFLFNQANSGAPKPEVKVQNIAGTSVKADLVPKAGLAARLFGKK